MSTLKDLVNSFTEMNPEDQLEKIRDIRRNKYVHRPALEKRKRQARKKSSASVAKLLGALSEADRAALVDQYGEDD